MRPVVVCLCGGDAFWVTMLDNDRCQMACVSCGRGGVTTMAQLERWVAERVEAVARPVPVPTPRGVH